jgi:hypothetical protein
VYQGLTFGAHALSYRWFMSTVQPGQFVLHRCDNPGCVRPDHLWAGSQRENMADKRAKGRAAKGEGHGMSKLRLGQVRKIFILREQGWSQSKIAEKFKVTQPYVSDILSGRRGSWRGALTEGRS